MEGSCRKLPVYSVKGWSHQVLRQWGGSSAELLVRGARWMPPKPYLRWGTVPRFSRGLNCLWLKWQGWNFVRNCQSNHVSFGKERRTFQGHGLAKDRLYKPEVRAAPQSCWIGNFSNPENISKAGKSLVFSSSLEDCAPRTTAEHCVIFFSGRLSSAAFVEAGIVSVAFCKNAHLLFFQRKSFILVGFLVMALERSERSANRRTRWLCQCRIQNLRSWVLAAALEVEFNLSSLMALNKEVLSNWSLCPSREDELALIAQVISQRDEQLSWCC